MSEEKDWNENSNSNDAWDKIPGRSEACSSDSELQDGIETSKASASNSSMSKDNCDDSWQPSAKVCVLQQNIMAFADRKISIPHSIFPRNRLNFTGKELVDFFAGSIFNELMDSAMEEATKVLYGTRVSSLLFQMGAIEDVDRSYAVFEPTATYKWSAIEDSHSQRNSPVSELGSASNGRCHGSYRGNRYDRSEFLSRNGTFGEGRPTGRGRGRGRGARSSNHSDWTCENCSASNFSRRVRCFKCREAKPGNDSDDRYHAGRFANGSRGRGFKRNYDFGRRSFSEHDTSGYSPYKRRRYEASGEPSSQFRPAPRPLMDEESWD